MADPKIKYDIEAAVKGDADVDQLASQLRQLGDTLEGDLKTQALQAAQALEAMGAKQGALDSFARLKRESQELGSTLNQATAEVDRLGAELPQAASNTAALASAERAAASALDQAQGGLQRKKDALQALRAETTGAARRTTEYRQAVDGLKAGITAATAEVNTHKAGLSAAQRASVGAQNAEAALRKEYDLAVGSAARLSAQMRDKNAALINTRSAMQQAGLSTSNLAQQEATLRTAMDAVRQTVADLPQQIQRKQAADAAAAAAAKSHAAEEDRLAAIVAASRSKMEAAARGEASAILRDAAAVDAARARSATVAEQTSARAIGAQREAATASERSTQQQLGNQRTLRDGMTSISTQLQRIQQLAMVAVGGGFFGGLIKDVAATADTFRNLEARIKLATGEGPNFETSFAGVQRVALATNTALDETGTLFARLTKAAQEGGASATDAQQRALALTSTINQSIQLSGSSAESSKAAIIQLIQGLQSGVLRGEEFNSVMEQAPRLAQALANGLGVTTGRLREMSQQGQLTAETVMKALENQSDAVAAEFDKLPPTVGRALQNLSSQWTLYVGASDKGLLSSANAAKVIDALAANLDTLVSTLTTAGKVWAAMKIAQMAEGFATWAARTLAATQATEANSAATVANTAAHRANAAAVAASTTAQASAATATAAATASTVAGTAAQALSAHRWGELGQALKGVTVTQGELQRSTARTTAFVDATAAAKARMAASATQAAGKVGLLGSAVKGVTGLLGGPIGLAATVAMMWPQFNSLGVWLGESTAKLMGHGKGLKALEEAERNAAEAAKVHAESQRRLALAQQEARDASFGLGAEAKKMVAEFDKLTRAGDSAGAAIGKIGKDFDTASIQGIGAMSAALDKLAADGKINAGQMQQAWAQALDGKDLAQFEAMARAAFAGSAREAERLAQMTDATLRAAVQRTGVDYDVLQGKIGAAARSAINDTDQIIGGLQRLRDQGIDAGRALEVSLTKAIDTADSQQAIDAVRARIQSLRTDLGSKVTDGLLDQASDKARALGDAADQAKPGINSLREAMKQLGVESDQSLRDAAKNAKQAYDEVTRSGEATERELNAAFKRAADAAIQAADGVAPQWVRLEAAARGYRLEVDAAGNAHLKMGDKALTGADKVQAAFARMGVQTSAETGRIAKQAKDDYNTMLFSGQATSEGLEKAFRTYAESAIAANGGVASEFLQAEAAQHGLAIAYDRTGKAVVRSAQEMGNAMHGAFQRGNAAIEEHMGYLDRLAKRNAEVKSAIAKDANGYAVDEQGRTVVAREDPALRNQRLAAMFGEDMIGNANAEAAYSLKRRIDLLDKQSFGEGDGSLGLLRKELERLTAAMERDRAASQQKNQPTERAPATRTAGTDSSDTDRPSRGGGVSAGRSSGSGVSQRNYVSNFNFQDQTIPVRTTDAANQAALEDVIRRLTDAKRVAL